MPEYRRAMKLGVLSLMLAATLLALIKSLPANDFQCSSGQKLMVDLGAGVRLQSCSWEKTPGQFVRFGPMELIREDILILKLETDQEGRLQGQYRSWDDYGILLEKGQYRDGLKEGLWRTTNEQGHQKVVFFKAGIALPR